jgi:hypothetical protein
MMSMRMTLNASDTHYDAGANWNPPKSVKTAWAPTVSLSMIDATPEPMRAAEEIA